MTSVVDLAKLANAVYDDVLSVGEWSRVGQPFTEHASTFKAALYQNRQTTDFSLAIAGTKALGDLGSDVQLAMGRTPAQYRMARTAFASSVGLTGGLVDFYMAGHSLGGGLVSMLGKEHGYPTVTFNAPGMARAFSHLESNEPGLNTVRDDDRKVLHICAVFDLVSRGTGAHMGVEGSVERVSTGAAGAGTVVAGAIGAALSFVNPLLGAAAAGLAATAITGLKAHGMDRMVATLENLPQYNEDLDWV